MNVDHFVIVKVAAAVFVEKAKIYPFTGNTAIIRLNLLVNLFEIIDMASMVADVIWGKISKLLAAGCQYDLWCIGVRNSEISESEFWNILELSPLTDSLNLTQIGWQICLECSGMIQNTV